MCFVWLSEQRVTFALYIIRRLVSVTEVESVYSAVRTGSLYNMDTFCPLKVKAQRLSWFGHVQRMPDTRRVKKIFNWKPLTKRSQGRPKYRWDDSIKQDICQMKIQNWIACVQDRGKWKEVVKKPKLSTREFSAWKTKKKKKKKKKRTDL